MKRESRQLLQDAAIAIPAGVFLLARRDVLEMQIAALKAEIVRIENELQTVREAKRLALERQLTPAAI